MFFALSAWKILFLRLCQESPFYMINRHICIYMKRLSLHLSSLPVCSGVPVTRSLVLCVCFVDCCLSFSLFSFDHCVVCSSSIYGFWLPLWYLQILLIDYYLFKLLLNDVIVLECGKSIKTNNVDEATF